jgi:hypothetical protein
MRPGIAPRWPCPRAWVFCALALGGAECPPGDLGQQIVAAAGDLPQFGRSGRCAGFGQAAPAGMADGGAGDLRHEQPVTAGSEVIMSHLTIIEYVYDKDKLPLLVSACWSAGKEPAMEGLTPASPDSLPPLAEMVADEPFWRYRPGAAGEGAAHLRVWLTA